MNLHYKQNIANQNQICELLFKCNPKFIPPLDQRVDIGAYSSKIFENAITLEAWDNGTIIGLVAFYINKNRGYITNVCVDDRYQGIGVASQLMKDCAMYAASNNVNVLELEVHEGNDNAIRLYKGHKFIKVSQNASWITLRRNMENPNKIMHVQKATVSDLAIFGGSRLFDEKLHVGRPNLGDREKLLERIAGAIDRKWLTNRGPLVQEFERVISDYLGVKHCIAMCNATVALEIAMRALGLKGEVIVPSFTFIATAHALQWQEITPVFCDIRTSDFTIDPERIEELITPRTSGIVGVHLWGRPCDILHIEQIARKRNLKVLFDAAHSFGCSFSGRMIGSFGDAEVFSFHGTKFLNSLEGGAVVTNDDELAKKIRLMKNFGFDGYDNVIYVGTNGKMNEFSAAMGLTNLESIDHFVQINKLNYYTYKRELAGLPGVRLIEYNEQEKCNYQYVVVVIDERITGLDCNALVRIFHAENVLVRRYFYPGCHQMEPYRSFFPHAGLLLPNTEKYSCKVMSFPTGTSISSDHIKSIAAFLRFVLGNASQICNAPIF